MLAGECDVSSTEMDGHVDWLKSVPISNMGEVDLPWVNYRQIFMRVVLKDRKKKSRFLQQVETSCSFILSPFLHFPHIRCGISSCCEPWSGTASYIFELGSGLLLSLYVCSFISPPNFKYPLLAFSRQNTDNRSKARTICVGLEKSGWLSGEQLTWCYWVGCCKAHWLIIEFRSKQSIKNNRDVQRS